MKLFALKTIFHIFTQLFVLVFGDAVKLFLIKFSFATKFINDFLRFTGSILDASRRWAAAWRETEEDQLPSFTDRVWADAVRDSNGGHQIEVKLAMKQVLYNFLINFAMFFYSRKYNLRKVMVNGDIPPKVKQDAHAVILEFIRSRPPLRKVSRLSCRSSSYHWTFFLVFVY